MGLDVRPVDVDEHDAAVRLFGTAILFQPPNPADLERARDLSLGRTFGAFLDGELVGTAGSFGAAMALPGGAQVPSGAVTRVGVLPTHTRRGILTALMRVQLADLVARGEVVAHLRATEAPIYGRYGYGVATQYARLVIDRVHGAFRDPVDAGSLRVVGRDELVDVLPRAYARCWGRRPGTIERPAELWSFRLRRPLSDPPPARWVVAHLDDAGEPDGFVDYEAVDREHWNGVTGTVQVHDLWGADDAVEAALWRFLLDLDLAPRLEVGGRPLDDPVRWRLVDHRRLRTRSVDDEVWLRVLDVGAALGARRYGDGHRVVVEVSDALLPDNDGTWAFSPYGCERVEEPADLAVGVDVLGAASLGGTSWAELAAAGRVDERSSGAVRRVDRLFAHRPLPWCGTYF